MNRFFSQLFESKTLQTQLDRETIFIERNQEKLQFVMTIAAAAAAAAVKVAAPVPAPGCASSEDSLQKMMVAKIKNPKTRIQNSKTKNQKSRINDLKITQTKQTRGIKNLRWEIQKTEIKNSQPKFKSRKSKTGNQKSKTNDR